MSCVSSTRSRLREIPGCVLLVLGAISNQQQQPTAKESSPEADATARRAIDILRAPAPGHWTWASEYRSEALSADELAAVVKDAAQNHLSEAALGTLGELAKSSVAKDNYALETLAVGGSETKTYYFSKDFGFGADSGFADSMTECSRGNGKRVLVRDYGGPALDNASIVAQPQDAADHLWMFGIARNMYHLADVCVRRGARLGSSVWQLDKPTPSDFAGVLRPAWPVSVGSIGTTLSPVALGVSTLRTAMMGVDGACILEYTATFVADTLVDIRCRIPWPGASAKLFVEMRAVVLGASPGAPEPTAGSVLARWPLDRDAYLVDTTNKNQRIDPHGSDLPPDFDWVNSNAPPLARVATGFVPTVRLEHSSHPVVELWPPIGSATMPVRDGHFVVYVRNSGLSPVRIKEVSTSCGCITADAIHTTLHPFETVPIDLRVTVKAIKPESNGAVMYVSLADDADVPNNRVIEWHQYWKK